MVYPRRETVSTIRQDIINLTGDVWSSVVTRPKRCKHHKMTCVLMILKPRSFLYPNSVRWFSWYRDAPLVFPENRPGAAATQIELVISRILNRWKAKILLVPEEAMVELICFILRSSCLQHPSRTMGAHGLWMKQQLLVDFWGFRHASLTRTYQFLNILESTLQPWMLLCDCVNIQMSTTQTLKYFVRHTQWIVVNYSASYLLSIFFHIHLKVPLEPAVPGNQAIYWNVSKWYCWCVASGASVEWECWLSSKTHKKVLQIHGSCPLAKTIMQHFIQICRGLPAMSCRVEMLDTGFLLTKLSVQELKNLQIPSGDTFDLREVHHIHTWHHIDI